MSESLGRFKAAVMAKANGLGVDPRQVAVQHMLGSHPQGHGSADGGHVPMHPAEVEVHKHHIKENLKRVRRAEAHHELDSMAKKRHQDIEKESDELFSK